jgi:hypothetical protein
MNYSNLTLGVASSEQLCRFELTVGVRKQFLRLSVLRMSNSRHLVRAMDCDRQATPRDTYEYMPSIALHSAKYQYGWVVGKIGGASVWRAALRFCSCVSLLSVSFSIGNRQRSATMCFESVQGSPS